MVVHQARDASRATERSSDLPAPGNNAGVLVRRQGGNGVLHTGRRSRRHMYGGCRAQVHPVRCAVQCILVGHGFSPLRHGCFCVCTVGFEPTDREENPVLPDHLSPPLERIQQVPLDRSGTCTVRLRSLTQIPLAGVLRGTAKDSSATPAFGPATGFEPASPRHRSGYAAVALRRLPRLHPGTFRNTRRSPRSGIFQSVPQWSENRNLYVPGEKVPVRLTERDLNSRPRPYQDRALTI